MCVHVGSLVVRLADSVIEEITLSLEHVNTGGSGGGNTRQLQRTVGVIRLLGEARLNAPS